MSTADELAKFRVRELKVMATELGVSTAGRKAEIIERILDAHADEDMGSESHVESEAEGTPSPAPSPVKSPKAATPARSPTKEVNEREPTPETRESGTSALAVLLFVPNLIGYARVALMFVFVMQAETQPKVAGWAYFMSYFLDAFDGYAARALNQSTRFGTVLDMVTDRCTTAALGMVMITIWPQYTLFWVATVLLDYSAHFVRMYTSVLVGATSHKDVDDTAYAVLRWYYKSRVLMFLSILGTEGLAIYAYLLKFGELYFVTLPFGEGEQVGLWLLMLYVCVPFFAFKQLTNVLQLVEGCQILVGFDVEARRKKDA